MDRDRADRTDKSAASAVGVSRQQEAFRLAEDLLRDVELGQLAPDRCLFKCARLARLVQDDQAREWIDLELHGYGGSDPGVVRWMGRMGRWTDIEKKKGYYLSLGALIGHLDALRESVPAYRIESVSGDWANLVSARSSGAISSATQVVGALSRVIANVVSYMYSFTSKVYYELMFSETQAALFESSRQEIDARLAAMAGDALSKIDSINERLNAGEVEAVSQAMSTCRRLIDSAADALFPASDEKFLVGEQPLQVKANNVVNRLQAYTYLSGVAEGRRNRIRRTLSDIYERVSSGVHSEVSIDEARYLFLQTYVVIGEILTLPTPIDKPSQ